LAMAYLMAGGGGGGIRKLCLYSVFNILISHNPNPYFL